jgi:RimJ/RimL family protein N-acetyltransferase
MIGIRRLDEKDLKPALKCRNDPRVFTWCRQYAPLHEWQHRNWFHNQSIDKTMEMFAIDYYDEFAGVCGLTGIDMLNRRAEFSCYVSPDKQGKGIGKAALIKLFTFGFYSLGLNRIWGEVFDGNHAYNTFMKLGMEDEGRRKEFYYRDGRFIDANLVSIGREQFDAMLAKLPII